MHKPAAIIDPASARDAITSHAYVSGLKAGTLSALVTGSTVYTANTYSHVFRTRLGVSGKWGLVVSSFLGAFAIVSDKAILHGARDPDKYLASIDPTYRSLSAGASVAAAAGGSHDAHQQLKLYQRAANYLYDHPYKTLAVIGVPLVGGIFAYQSTNHALARSQQIMHTRLYGQGAVVLLLLGSMAFHDYMQKRGRFRVASHADVSSGDVEEL